jgi:hypothetical protein
VPREVGRHPDLTPSSLHLNPYTLNLRLNPELPILSQEPSIIKPEPPTPSFTAEVPITFPFMSAPHPRHAQERMFIEFMTSDRQHKASREGLK